MNHLLAGVLVFLFGSKIFNIKPNNWFLLLGAFWAIFPDLLSYGLQILGGQIPEYSKWSHKHRDNFSHSLFFPPVLFVVSLMFVNWQQAALISAAALTHPLLDLFGLGWGVKIFYPFSNNTYKLFYNNKIINCYSQKEIDNIAAKYGMDDWIKRVYITFNPKGVSRWWGIIDWLCLCAAIALFFYYK